MRGQGLGGGEGGGGFRVRCMGGTHTRCMGMRRGGRMGSLGLGIRLVRGMVNGGN